jgi:hypothetical protein
VKQPNPIQGFVIVGILLFGGIWPAADAVGAHLTGNIAEALFWLFLVSLAPVWAGAVLPAPRLPANPDRPEGPPPEITQ